MVWKFYAALIRLWGNTKLQLGQNDTPDFCFALIIPLSLYFSGLRTNSTPLPKLVKATKWINDYQDQVSTAFRDLMFNQQLHKNSRHKAVSQLKSFSNIQIHLPYQQSTCCQQSEWVERTVEKLMTRKKISQGSFSNC